MKQIVMLNKEQLVQLAGLAAGSDDKCLTIKQEISTNKLEFIRPSIVVERTVSGVVQEHIMLWTGLHEKMRPYG